MPKKALPMKRSPSEYVIDSTTCIACETCAEIAPDNFAMKKTPAYVTTQPSTASATAACKEAMEVFPVYAISNG